MKSPSKPEISQARRSTCLDGWHLGLLPFNAELRMLNSEWEFSGDYILSRPKETNATIEMMKTVFKIHHSNYPLNMATGSTFEAFLAGV